MNILLLQSIYNQYLPSPYYAINSNGDRNVKKFKGLDRLIKGAIDYAIDYMGYVVVNFYFDNGARVSHILEENENQFNLNNLEYEFLLFITKEYTFIKRKNNSIFICKEINDSQGIKTPFDSLYGFIKEGSVYEIHFILDNIYCVSDLY